MYIMFQTKAIGGYTICHEKTTPQREHNYSITKQNKHK